MKELIEAADMSSLKRVVDFVETALNENAWPTRSVIHVLTAVDEVVSNVINYAYPDGNGTFRIELEVSDDILTIVLTDQGIPFDPLKAENPDVHAALNEREIGGLGIFMTKKLMDDVRYSRIDNKNVLTLIKHK